MLLFVANVLTFGSIATLQDCNCGVLGKRLVQMEEGLDLEFWAVWGLSRDYRDPWSGPIVKLQKSGDCVHGVLHAQMLRRV